MSGSQGFSGRRRVCTTDRVHTSRSVSGTVVRSKFLAQLVDLSCSLQLPVASHVHDGSIAGGQTPHRIELLAQESGYRWDQHPGQIGGGHVGDGGRSDRSRSDLAYRRHVDAGRAAISADPDPCRPETVRGDRDRKSTRLNSSHGSISYAVFCLKKKKKQNHEHKTVSTIR